MKTIQEPAKPESIQTISGHLVTVRKYSNGTKFVFPVLADGSIDRQHGVPVEIASLAAGKDAWMRQVLVRCSDCKEKHTIETLFQDVPMCCPACAEKALAEMEHDNA